MGSEGSLEAGVGGCACAGAHSAFEHVVRVEKEFVGCGDRPDQASSHVR